MRAYRASRSALYAAISPFASSTAARNRAVFSAFHRASRARSRQSPRRVPPVVRRPVVSIALAFAPSRAALTIACASFSASMSFEIPSRDASIRATIARPVASRTRAPRATSVSLSRTTATRTKDDRSTKTLARGRHTARTMFASSTTSLTRPTNSFVTGNNDGLKRTMMRGAAAVKRAPLVVESTCRDATTRGWGRATRARMRASRARVRARGVVNVAETRAAKYLARVRGGADDDDGRARARDWVIRMAD